MQPKRKVFHDFYDELEFHLSSSGIISTIPSAIKEIMTAAGYNSAMSIIPINEQKLDFIEKYVEENCRNVVDTFKEYSNRKPFAFLPGHRECIFGIRDEILKMQNRKTIKISNTSRTSDQVTNINEEELRLGLETQVSNFANRLGLMNFDWGASINSFQMTKKDSSVQAKCVVVCPECDATNSVSYTTHWQISNLFRHLRKHEVHVINKINSKTQKLGKETPFDDAHYQTIYVEVVSETSNSNDNEGATNGANHLDEVDES